MSRSDGLEGSLEIGEGLNAVDLRGLDQGGDTAPSFPALVVTCEQGILSVQSDWADQVFDAVGVDLDAAIVQESLQSVPMVLDISELLTQA